MADLSDITAFLAQAAAAAVYPNGTTQPSIAGMDVRVFEGWPTGEQIDLDVGGTMLTNERPPRKVARPNGPAADVSIYPMPGAAAEPYQLFTRDQPLLFPSFGMSFSVNGNTVTVTGVSQPNEYLTIVIDNKHAYSRVGANIPSILQQLLDDMLGDYPTATASASTLTIPAAFRFTVRQGGQGAIGHVSHRQRQAVMITTWAPNHRARAIIAAAIDVALKEQVTVMMVDGSMALLCYSRSNQTDEQQLQTVYRRDLIYEAEYATVTKYPAWIVTSVDVQLQAGNFQAAQPVLAIADFIT